MATPLKIVILEDNADDAALIAHALREAGYEPDWQRVDDEAGFTAALSSELDLILADYSLPQFDALRALGILQTHGLDVPFIVVTGTLEEAAVEAMKRGADDYLLKDRLARLGEAVRRALHERALRREKREAERRLRASELLHRVTLANISDVVLMTNDAGRFTYVSPSVEPIFGYTVREVEALDHVWALLGADLYDPVTLARQGEITNIECEIADRAGSPRRFLITVKTVQIQGDGRRPARHLRAADEHARPRRSAGSHPRQRAAGRAQPASERHVDRGRSGVRRPQSGELRRRFVQRA
jgi:PAS domain S-box-containing protein